MRLVKSRGSTAANDLDRPNSLVSVFRFLRPGEGFYFVSCLLHPAARGSLRNPPATSRCHYVDLFLTRRMDERA